MTHYRDYDAEERRDERQREYQNTKREPYLKKGFDLVFDPSNFMRVKYIHCLTCGNVTHDTGLHRSTCRIVPDRVLDKP